VGYGVATLCIASRNEGSRIEEEKRMMLGITGGMMRETERERRKARVGAFISVQL